MKKIALFIILSLSVVALLTGCKSQGTHLDKMVEAVTEGIKDTSDDTSDSGKGPVESNSDSEEENLGMPDNLEEYNMTVEEAAEKAVEAKDTDIPVLKEPGAVFKLEGEDPVVLSWEQLKSEPLVDPIHTKYGYFTEQIYDDSIQNDAFFGCEGLIAINIPEGITNVSTSAFGGCSNLTDITFPKSLKIIGLYTFRDCKGLRNIEIPEDINEIGHWAFADCDNLTSVVYKGKEYSNKTDLINALSENGVTLEGEQFPRTPLAE